MSVTTGFFLHPSSPLHDTGWNHPEHQGRLRALASAVGQDLLTLHDHVVQMEHSEATNEDLIRVHTEAHVDRVREAWEVAKAQDAITQLDPDTRVSAASWDAAVGSAGTAIAAAAAVAEGSIRNAFVAARPPGHHATPDRAMGFCLFNSTAITARWLQAHSLAEKVLIVDWDVHHGNGTQDTFYADSSVFFLSLHQSPHYPGTGAADERGEGEGVGYTMNVPLAAGTSRSDYLASFEGAWDEVMDTFAPDFVLMSAGFDVMAGDPLGDQLLEPEDLHRITRRVIDAARDTCDGKVVALLEGGYNPRRLGEGAVAVIRALAGLEAETG